VGPTWLVANPAAGGGRARKRLPALLDALRAGGVDVSVKETSGPGDATSIARAGRAAGVERFLVAGGDGTSCEVVSGLFPHDGPPPTLGMIPLGTGNSFLRDVGVTSTDTAIAAVIAGQTRPVDVLRLDCDEGPIHAINLVGVGFAADAGELMNRRFKALGALGYVAGVLGRLVTLAPRAFPLSLDGGPRDDRPATLLSFSNSQYTGGAMHMAPAARLDDGRVDVIRVGPMGRMRLLSVFPKIFQGTHVTLPEVEVTTAARIDLELADAVDLMIDGEVLRRRLRSIRVLPSALRVVSA
jgi:diacylglycerol kinase (ATP)